MRSVPLPSRKGVRSVSVEQARPGVRGRVHYDPQQQLQHELPGEDGLWDAPGFRGGHAPQLPPPGAAPAVLAQRRVMMSGVTVIAAQTYPAVKRPVGVIAGAQELPPASEYQTVPAPNVLTLAGRTPPGNTYGLGTRQGRYPDDEDEVIAATTPRVADGSPSGRSGSLRRQRSSGVALSPQPSLAQALQDISALHAEGGLTDEEFAAAKTGVLKGAERADPNNRTLASMLDTLDRSPSMRSEASGLQALQVMSGLHGAPSAHSPEQELLQRQGLQLQALIEENSALRAAGMMGGVDPTASATPVWEHKSPPRQASANGSPWRGGGGADLGLPAVPHDPRFLTPATAAPASAPHPSPAPVPAFGGAPPPHAHPHPNGSTPPARPFRSSRKPRAGDIPPRVPSRSPPAPAAADDNWNFTQLR
eukprot:TRINITY_DN16182_c0_g1_i1.p1 TRINITY_DN16182_c0_g1~~TRINITY_DN16182_c0_g1_i1.p1  ORF type:complete len:420 (+),score=94.02 TRINITY_DN16182_c0_g1_i1:53-1312(+)